MNHLKWMGHVATIQEIQRNLFHEESTCDVSICVKGKLVRAHRFVLCSCSDFFKEMLADIPQNQEATIIIPDFKEDVIENVISFIYMGEVFVRSSNLTEFLESINLLGIKSAISFECQVNKRKPAHIFATIDEDSAEPEKNISQDEESPCVEQCAGKDFEYLEVYNEDEKIGQFTIEHIEQDSNGDYILAEHSENSFTLPEEKNVGEKDGGQIDFEEAADAVDVPGKDELQAKFDDDKKDDVSINELMQSRNEAFDGAVHAVIECGMSLQKAATKFNISKTVLWRRVKKHPSYKIYRENPLIEAAITKLQKGESLKSISLALDIPMSTLHRHKMRLLQQGRLPEHVQVKKRDSKETLKLRLAKAVEACRHGMSQNQAASVFGVPKSTLWRHLQKQLQKPVKKELIEEISLSN